MPKAAILVPLFLSWFPGYVKKYVKDKVCIMEKERMNLDLLLLLSLPNTVELLLIS